VITVPRCASKIYLIYDFFYQETIMSEPFLSEIKIVAFTFAPRGWALCDGQLLPINQNQSLFSLLGTMYGGDGRTTFALPELRGRTPIHFGNNHPQGQRSGEESHTLTVAEMPAHTHQARATEEQANTNDPANNIWSAQPDGTHYGTVVPGASMASASITSVGGNQAHNNMQPFLALNFAIALQGLFPSRN
jgi:microcystin-dependent protein